MYNTAQVFHFSVICHTFWLPVSRIWRFEVCEAWWHGKWDFAFQTGNKSEAYFLSFKFSGVAITANATSQSAASPLIVHLQLASRLANTILQCSPTGKFSPLYLCYLVLKTTFLPSLEGNNACILRRCLRPKILLWINENPSWGNDRTSRPI